MLTFFDSIVHLQKALKMSPDIAISYWLYFCSFNQQTLNCWLSRLPTSVCNYKRAKCSDVYLREASVTSLENKVPTCSKNCFQICCRQVKEFGWPHSDGEEAVSASGEWRADIALFLFRAIHVPLNHTFGRVCALLAARTVTGIKILREVISYSSWHISRWRYVCTIVSNPCMHNEHGGVLTI